MLNILPFSPYELQESHGPKDTAALKPLLEPSTANNFDLGKCSRFFENLLHQGSYAQPERKSLYIYRHTSGHRQVLALWCRIDASAYADGRIIGHEQTLEQTLDELRSYRQQVGLEGAPVLLAYRPESNLDLLLAGWSMGVPDFSYQQGKQVYEFWRVGRPEEVELVCELAGKLGQLYIADGHHRMATAAASGECLSAILISSGQLDIHGYHRIVVLPEDFSRDSFLTTIEKHWYRSEIPSNKEYSPDRKRRMGMFLEGKWYQLDLKETVKAPLACCDAQLLQETILSAGLGIDDPATSGQLGYYADGQLPAMFGRLYQGRKKVAFTLYPIGVEELLLLAENGVNLPPKSTWIEPRAPYGLLIDQSHPYKTVKQ